MFHALLTPRISCRALRPVTAALVALAALAGMLALPAHAPAVNLPPGFEESMAFTDLDQPIAMQFSQDGRVFVAEKSGIIKVFDGLGDTTPTDVRRPAHAGPQLLGPRARWAWRCTPTSPRPRTCTSTTCATRRSAAPPPRWGDHVPDPPGGTGDGCVVSGRISS